VNLGPAHLSQKFYGGGGENGFKEGRDDTAAGISSIKPFFNQEVVIVSMSIVTAWHDLEKGSRLSSLAKPLQSSAQSASCCKRRCSFASHNLIRKTKSLSTFPWVAQNVPFDLTVIFRS
jgi:hypothetical protein